MEKSVILDIHVYLNHLLLVICIPSNFSNPLAILGTMAVYAEEDKCDIERVLFELKK